MTVANQAIYPKLIRTSSFTLVPANYSGPGAWEQVVEASYIDIVEITITSDDTVDRDCQFILESGNTGIGYVLSTFTIPALSGFSVSVPAIRGLSKIPNIPVDPEGSPYLRLSLNLPPALFDDHFFSFGTQLLSAPTAGKTFTFTYKYYNYL
jgi:hypothetical protein